MSKSMDDLFEQLHQEVAKELLAKVKSGEAPHQVLKEAREFLKDNGVQGQVKKNNPLGQLVGSLPDFDPYDIGHS